MIFSQKDQHVTNNVSFGQKDQHVTNDMIFSQKDKHATIDYQCYLRQCAA